MELVYRPENIDLTGIGIPVEINFENFDNEELAIRAIKETLTRIGIANKTLRVLYPTCYLIDDDDGNYKIAHFKELFGFIRPDATCDLTDDDLDRRDTIIGMLQKWHMINTEERFMNDKYIFVLKSYEKPDWLIKHKINVRGIFS